MAYIRVSDETGAPGFLGCGAQCRCRTCRSEPAELSEWYVPDDEDAEDDGAEADTREPSSLGESCTPAPGIPNTSCSTYAANSWWLPLAYVNNATCACRTIPNSPTADCVRKFLQDRLAATPAAMKALAASQKPLEASAFTYPAYQAFVQGFLTPRIYRDHADAYRSCCCPAGPAEYPAWMGVTSVPIQPCSLVGASIRHFGSCHGTPGTW